MKDVNIESSEPEERANQQSMEFDDFGSIKLHALDGKTELELEFELDFTNEAVEFEGLDKSHTDAAEDKVDGQVSDLGSEILGQLDRRGEGGSRPGWVGKLLGKVRSYPSAIFASEVAESST